MTQQESGFVRPGNVFTLLRPVVVTMCPLEQLLVFSWYKWIPVWLSAAIAHTYVKDWQVMRSRDVTLCRYLSVLAHQLACTILAILLRLLSSISCFHPQGYHWPDVAPFSVNPRHCHAWKAQEACCFWDDGIGAPGIRERNYSLMLITITQKQEKHSNKIIYLWRTSDVFNEETQLDRKCSVFPKILFV